MKKRIYKINNKNLVTGNPNEVTENEILVKENNDGTVELSHRNNGTLETLGSGGNGGSSNIKYYDVSNLDINMLSPYLMIVMSSLIGKYRPSDIDPIEIVPNFSLQLTSTTNKLFAVGIDMDMLMCHHNISNELITVRDVLITAQLYDTLIACPELTEEQFYDTTLPTE